MRRACKRFSLGLVLGPGRRPGQPDFPCRWCWSPGAMVLLALVPVAHRLRSAASRRRPGGRLPVSVLLAAEAAVVPCGLARRLGAGLGPAGGRTPYGRPRLHIVDGWRWTGRRGSKLGVHAGSPGGAALVPRCHPIAGADPSAGDLGVSINTLPPLILSDYARGAAKCV